MARFQVGKWDQSDQIVIRLGFLYRGSLAKKVRDSWPTEDCWRGRGRWREREGGEGEVVVEVEK